MTNQEVDEICQLPTPNEYVSAQTDRTKTRGKTKNKQTHSLAELGSSQEIVENSSNAPLIDSKHVRIYAIYDSFDKLVHIKFDKNKYIPRSILKIIGLIIKFQSHLTSITINRGLDVYIVHEISKILPNSHITDICLDGTFLKNANYYILLENSSCIRHISLARCMIDDMMLKKISENLAYPLPSSKTLCVLNISSNRITDSGVKYLAEALRSNRQLRYLNLADNSITDDGASAILNILVEFPLSWEDVIKSRERRMKYFREKNKLVAKILVELRRDKNYDKKSARKKTAIPSNNFSKKAGKGIEDEQSTKALADTNRSVLNTDPFIFDRAEDMAVNAIGLFADPYSPNNTTLKDGIVYCTGNTALSYLNLSYNNLGYFSLKKILSVLKYQKFLDSKPRGLINMCIEGNCTPVVCKELTQINAILEIGLIIQNKPFGSKNKSSHK
ncbi:Uncharacterized protein OBRU01_01306 [Operophtera brumata]|uniref:Leucine-rich repeat-containing protein 71 n=1 Tax=Operophtera brumata TaxID=104452 RepID=A0A0L7LU98_OPEBR|nr:Uncharacterized protein OBRU01_01306 [Operophtera brumata]